MKLLSLALLLVFPPMLGAGERVALVIGCNRYANFTEGQQLTSPVSDATDVAAALKSLGYKLVSGGPVTDAGKDAIITATERFAVQAKNADAAVFYFSGHGMEVGDDRFLMPSDTPQISSYTVLKNRSVNLRDAVMVALEEADVKTKVIILDCCRDNPFALQIEQALAQVGSKSLRTKGGLSSITGYGRGIFLAHATSPGTVADDGNGRRNSPFTAALLQHFKTSAGEDITLLFRKVKTTVLQMSGEEQVPWTEDSLNEPFSLAAAGTPPPAGAVPGAAAAQTALVERPPSVPSLPGSPGTKPGIPVPARGYHTLDEIFAGTAYAGFNNHTRSLILKRAQDQLKASGLYYDEPDGAAGPNTHAAIKAWQERAGLTATGSMDQETLRSMNLTGISEVAPPVVNRQPALRSQPDAPPSPRPAPNSNDAFRDMARRFDRL